MLSPLRTALLIPARARALATAQQTLAHGLLPASNSPVSPKLTFFNSVAQGSGQIPTYRVLDGVGIPIEGAELPDVGFSLSLSCLLCSSAHVDHTRVCSQAVSFYPSVQLDCQTFAILVINTCSSCQRWTTSCTMSNAKAGYPFMYVTSIHPFPPRI